MTWSWLRLGFALTAVLAVPGTVLAQVNQSRPPSPNQLAGLKSTIWQNLEIPVCWENPSPADAQERGWVRSTVHETWEQHSALHFVGWGRCEPSSRGIRIGVADINPHTKGLGNQLDRQRESMMLNFSFEV
jgi:hypothetical protein